MKMMCSLRIGISALVGLMIGVQAQAADYWFDNNGTATGFGVADGGSYDWWAVQTLNTSATLEGLPPSWKVSIVASEIYLQGTVGTLLSFR